jgi:hypothetical protein
LKEDPGLREPLAAAGASGDPVELEALCDRLAGHPGVALARERALAYVAQARAAIDGPLDGADADALVEIADGVVDRYG